MNNCVREKERKTERHPVWVCVRVSGRHVCERMGVGSWVAHMCVCTHAPWTRYLASFTFGA